MLHPKQGGDIQTTVSLLTLLTRAGADVDARRNNGEVALHTAARRGPYTAVVILLVSKATHDIKDHRNVTPESAAIRAGNGDATKLLASWRGTRQQYRNDEFIDAWMKFLCDPDANLDTDLTAEEVLAQVRMEGHEESAAVRARGGHLLIDEIITGPVLSAEQRAHAKILAFSATDSVSMVTATDSSGSGGSGGSGAKLPPNSGCISTQGSGRTRVDGTRRGGAREGAESGDAKRDTRQTKTKSKLGKGKELDVYLAQARDEAAGILVGGAAGESSAYSRLMAKEQLERRKNRWPGPRDNGKDPPTGGAWRGSSADPFGRPMTTSQRRRIAALEVAEDGGRSTLFVKEWVVSGIETYVSSFAEASAARVVSSLDQQRVHVL